MKKIILIAGLLMIGSYSFASQTKYECGVSTTFTTYPFNEMKKHLILTISENPNGKNSIELSYESKKLIASHYIANLYVSREQDFFSGNNKPEFVNVTIDQGLSSGVPRGTVYLTAVWPHLKSDVRLYCDQLK